MTEKLLTVASNDRAFNYGDGVFTTLCIQAGRVALYHRHVQRLMSDCKRLKIEVNQDDIERAIKQEAAGLSDGVLKVLISAGTGGRGYTRAVDTAPHIYVSRHPMPEHYSDWQQQGISAGISSVKLSQQPLLAGIKHLNRLEQVLIRQHSDVAHTNEVIVTDSDDCVVETSAANLFWLKEGRWYTPDLTLCGVCGVMRSFLLDWLVEQQQPAQIGRYHVGQLRNAEAIFCSNSLMQLVPITKLVTGEHSYEFAKAPVHQLSDSIANQYEEEHVAAK